MAKRFYFHDLSYVSAAFANNPGVRDDVKRLFARFIRECEIEGLSQSRVIKYYSTFNILFKISPGFPLGSRDEEDIKKAVSDINASSYSEWTKHDLKVMIKKFYKVMVGKGEYPKCVKFLKTGLPLRLKRLPESLVSQEDVGKLIKAAKGERDRALVSVLWESGMRIGELASLRCRNVVFDDLGVVVTIPEGKTGARRIRLVESEHYLVNWLAVHPNFKPESFLFVNIEKQKGSNMSYDNVRKTLRTLALREGVEAAKVKPHNFRHGRASFLAKHLTEAQMNQFFGWEQGSYMPSIYVHLSGRDLDESYLKVYGKSIEKDKTAPRKCVRCKFMNPGEARTCGSCGAPLLLEEAIALEEERDKMLDEKIREAYRKLRFEELKQAQLKKEKKTT